METVQAELELQQELQRFTTEFTDRISQATETLDRSSRREVRDQALRKNLLYVSSALEIATGQISPVNLVNMIVFIHLSRVVLERHWIPELYGQEGAELAEVFARSEDTLSAVAEKALTPAQREQLLRITDAWLAENPGQVHVEGIRLADFAAVAGSAAAERATQAKGLLSSVKTATRAANQALLLSERGLFLLHRLPFLWRLQARLGAREVLGDAIAQLSEGPQAPVPKATRQLRQVARRGARNAGLFGAAGLLVWSVVSLITR